MAGHGAWLAVLLVNWNSLHAYAFSPTILIYSSQDMPVSVQNSSHCSFLAPTAVVLRVTLASSVSPDLSSTISKTSDTVKRKISTPKPHIT